MVFSNILFVVEYFLYRVSWKVFDTDNLWFIVAGQPLSTFLERVVFQITKSHKRWLDFCNIRVCEFSGSSRYIRPTDNSFSGVVRCITIRLSRCSEPGVLLPLMFLTLYIIENFGITPLTWHRKCHKSWKFRVFLFGLSVGSLVGA